MKRKVPVSKDEDHQSPIPEVWRNTFQRIVDALKDGDFRLERGIEGAKLASESVGEDVKKNIEDYGCKLMALPLEAWDTSVCQWMGAYWDVLIDLFTEEEGASDLVLIVRVFETEDGSYSFIVQSVHVP